MLLMGVFSNTMQGHYSFYFFQPPNFELLQKKIVTNVQSRIARKPVSGENVLKIDRLPPCYMDLRL